MRSFTIIKRAFDYCIINGTPEREKDCLAFKDLKYSRQMQGISRPVLLNNGCVRLLLPNWRLFKAFLPRVLLEIGQCKIRQTTFRGGTANRRIPTPIGYRVYTAHPVRP